VLTKAEDCAARVTSARVTDRLPKTRTAVVEVRITIDGTDADAESLWDWLRHEPELRGRIRRRSLPPPQGAMGSLTELVVDGIVTGTISTLAGLLGQSLSIWLTRPRPRSGSCTTITVTSTSDGQSVSLTTENAVDAERLLQTALGKAVEPSVPPDPVRPPDGQSG
jgi:Effector Associated Constant Component 1